MKKLLTFTAFIALAVMLYGCAPGAITPQPAYADQTMSTGPYPPSTRAGHFDENGFYISAGPNGLGLEVAQDHWRGALYGGYFGFNMRNSWSQDEFGVSLDTAYNTYETSNWVETSDGYGDYVYVNHQLIGLAIDGTYYFPIETDIGSAYAGPRLRAYFACESIDQSGYKCDTYGLLPGGAVGINVPVSAVSERLVFGLEGSVLVVIPGLSDSNHFSIFSPFAFSLSYHF